MKDASLYILLPQGDEVLGLNLTEEVLDMMMSPLITVKEYARLRGIYLQIFYDSENVRQFLKDVGALVEKRVYLDKPSTMLKRFISTYSKDLRVTGLLDECYNYTRWDTQTCMADPDAPLVVRSAFESSAAPCVLSLSPGIPTDYHQVSIIKDKAYADDMPELKKIPLFFTAEGCLEWLSSLEEGHFSLIGNQDFERTNQRWRKQWIYKRLEDNSYWYFDYFHKDNKIHYEVFDAVGKHLGEANADGTIQKGTKIEGRSISDILHGD